MTSDCHFTDCISVDYTVGFRMGLGGSNRLTQEWRTIRIPLSKLDYFKHWGNGPLEPGDRPDARHLMSIHFEFGNFLCAKTVNKAHGYEIASIHITGR